MSMGEAILFHEWRDENEQRNYPFADSALMTNGLRNIPRSTFIDARLYPIGGTVPLYLSRVTTTATQLKFTVAGTGVGELATAQVDIDALPGDGKLVFYDSFQRPAGIMLAASSVALSLFAGWGVGEEIFTAAQLPMAAQAVIPIPGDHVQSIVVDGQTFAGEVWLAGEDGIVLREEDDKIRIDVIGDPYAGAQSCRDQIIEGADCDPPTGSYDPIATINNISPNDLGDWLIAAGSLLFDDNPFKVTPQGNSLKIEIIGGRRTKMLD